MRQYHAFGGFERVRVYAARREDLGFEAGGLPDHEDDGMQQKQTRRAGDLRPLHLEGECMMDIKLDEG